MPKKSTAKLGDRIEGLALAFFAVSGAILKAIASSHPKGEDAVTEAYWSAMGIVEGVEQWGLSVFSPTAVEQAFRAVNAAFAAQLSREEGDNDNGPE